MSNSEEASEATNYTEVVWKEEHEKILVDWADKASCYRWLHDKSNKRFSFMNAMYTIPVIIMSTLTGTANFAQNQFPEWMRGFVPMIIGTINIIAGILQTIQQFLKISELNEAHRVSSISWGKFSRNIKVELAKRPSERIPVGQMMKMSKEEFDRLMETSPPIEEKVIKLFWTEFADSSKGQNPEQADRHKKFMEISKPEVCNELVSIDHFRYRPDFSPSSINEKLNVIETQKQKLINEMETQIVDFIKKFTVMHNRKPLENEITDNMKDKINDNTLNTLISKIKSETDLILITESDCNL